MCRYCGMEMKPKGYEKNNLYWYVCSDERCFSSSPSGETLDEAYAAAMRRPLQKPMTLEEARHVEQNAPMHLEEIGAEDMDTIWVRVCGQRGSIMIHDDGSVSLMPEDEIDWDNYYKTWRCWRTCPTDDERAAAEWEE